MFLIGDLFGAVFFLISCYWLTYPMIHYANFPWVMAYLLVAGGAVIAGSFFGIFTISLSNLIRKFGPRALFVAPFIWVSTEFIRFQVTGEMWNALGLAHAYVPSLIQTARWGGVYAVSSLIITINVAVAFFILMRKMNQRRAILEPLLILVLVAGIYVIADRSARSAPPTNLPAKPSSLVIIAIQPNVEVNFDRMSDEEKSLLERHFTMSETALSTLGTSLIADKMGGRLIIWPESPMNMQYSDDIMKQQRLADFASRNQSRLLFNSLQDTQTTKTEGGPHNSALLIDEKGHLISQYDKIHLLPFGEFVPKWLPGSFLLRAIVGDFIPGKDYVLMDVGSGLLAGVFICFESAFPDSAATPTREGADLLINITNDGYLGRTPVVDQHLANAVFRAIENDRTVVRVANTGISALITPHGEVKDATNTFVAATRTWVISNQGGELTFYTKHQLFFAMLSIVISLVAVFGANL